MQNSGKQGRQEPSRAPGRVNVGDPFSGAHYFPSGHAQLCNAITLLFDEDAPPYTPYKHKFQTDNLFLQCVKARFIILVNT